MRKNNRGNQKMKTGMLPRSAALLTLIAVALPAFAEPVAVDTTSPANGFKIGRAHV